MYLKVLDIINYVHQQSGTIYTLHQSTIMCISSGLLQTSETTPLLSNSICKFQFVKAQPMKTNIGGQTLKIL